MTMRAEVPEVRYAKSGDIHIAYQVFGSGPVNLVLTPGIISNISHHWKDPSWRRWLKGLGQFARTAIFDKRGTGLSDRNAGVPIFEERMDDIRAVMDAAGFDDAILVGFSDGVGMSALFAASYPSRTRGLVLYGGEVKGSWAPDHPWKATNERFAEDLERLERTYGTTEMAERWVSTATPSRTGDKAFLSWMTELIQLGGTPGAAVALWKSNFNMDVRSALPAIHAPTLVIHPTGDKMVDVRGGRYIAEHIPGARLVELPSGDHWAFVEARLNEVILNEIRQFATGLPPPPRNNVLPRVKPRPEAKQRIAVLPLVNMGADSRDEYFVDGMTEELITAISQLPDLKVIARTSVMRYKRSGKGAAEIGRELGVDSLIEGSVRKELNRVRVSVQLIDARSEEHTWAQTFDKEVGDVFALQSEIANQVSRRLKLKAVQSSTDASRRQPSDAEAHTLYLRARYQWNLRSEEGFREAIRYFEEAIKKDPEYSLALVGLADSYQVSALFGYARPADAYPKARDLAFRALNAGGAPAEAHASLGEFLMHYSYDWAGAARELERALQINPNYATAHVWRSTNYAVLGQLDSALVEARRGVELDPYSVQARNEVAKSHYYGRRYDEAADEYIRSLELEPDSAYLHKGLAETYALQSMADKATSEIERALAISGRSALYVDSAAVVYALSNREQKSREILAEVERSRSGSFVPSYGRAAAYASLGQKEKAIRLLQRAYDDHSWLIWVGVDPLFDPLRTEPEFQSLLRKMNLVLGPPSHGFVTPQLTAQLSQYTFEFTSERSRVIFEQLASDFVRDYMLENYMEEKSGWRSTVEIAHETGIPVSSLYPKGRGAAAPFRELWNRGILEMRVSPGERGRGGEITKVRVAYGKMPVREYVHHLAKVVKKPKPNA
ncbi:MAG: alpha/beta fold hydrolase [Thaumarchaeota archaeon]|nr:alpha/beta fold hydrolase [Nitrososphaerota archaeon]